MEPPDHPEPHPDDPWHPAWRGADATGPPSEEAQASEAAGRIQRRVEELAARSSDERAAEKYEADQRRRDQVAAVREQLGVAAAMPDAGSGPAGENGDGAIPADGVTPPPDDTVPESSVTSQKGGLWRRNRRRPGREAAAGTREEEREQVDGADRKDGEASDVAVGEASDVAVGEASDVAVGDEPGVEELTRSAAETEDEAIYASLAEPDPDADDFPWDDEDWSGATSGDDLPAADLDLVGLDGPPSNDADADPAAGVDDTAAGPVAVDDTGEDADAGPAAVDETGSGEAPVSGDPRGDALDERDVAEGRFSHAEVIPLVRPEPMDENAVSAGLDPDLVALAGGAGDDEADGDEADGDEAGTRDAASPDEPETVEDIPAAAATGNEAAGDEDQGDEDRIGEDERDEGGDEDDESDDPEDGFARFSLEGYTGTATGDYAELARAVAASEAERHELAAVSAEMPGLDTSLVSLDDVVDAGFSVTETISTTRRSDLGLRVATGLGLLAVFLGSLLWPWAIGVLILVVLAMAALELYVVTVNAGYRPLTWAGLIGVVGALVGTWVWGVIAIPIAAGLTFIGSTLFLAMSTERRTPLADLGLTVTTMGWIGVLGAPAFAIIDSPRYRWLILAIVITTAVMDVAQFFFGRWLGRRPLAPVVSPKKTIEGLVGGVFAALVIGVVFGSIEASPFDPASGLVFGAVVAVVAPIGDLAVSVVKRALDVKDMGSILPGHGGVLDRIDAMIFVIPSAWIMYSVFDMLG